MEFVGFAMESESFARWSATIADQSATIVMRSATNVWLSKSHAGTTEPVSEKKVGFGAKSVGVLPESFGFAKISAIHVRL